MTTNRVVFNEEAHTYHNPKGTVYTSSTTLVGKFKQPFDKKAVATKYAEKNGKTPEYWIKEWEKISKAACEKGTNFHKAKESHLLSLNGVSKEDKVVNVVDINKFVEPNIDYSTLPDGIYPELLLWNHYWEIAGISDIVIIDGDYFDIDDYKTNKKIDTRSYCHPRYGNKMMKPPINHLEDCNFNHYALQLSIYAYMLEKLSNKTCRSICFHHHPPHPDDATQVQTEGIRYNVPYLKSEVLAMLMVYRGKPVISL